MTTGSLRGMVWLCAILWLAVLGACGGEGATHEMADGHDHARDTTVWTCSMHPQIRQTAPGSCPICGMDLIPASTAPQAADDAVHLTPRAAALAKLRTTVVERRSDPRADLRLLGRVEPDESTRRNVTTWIGGRIDRLHVNTTGARIRRGQVIASLYSPEVYGAHQDLLAAKVQVARLRDGAPTARDAAQAALSAARQRLTLLGVPADEIDSMATADAPRRSIDIRSPFTGTVIERAATEGAYVDTGATLYRVADLSTVWVQLDAYETDLATLREGQAVTLTVDALPGRTFAGRVAFIDPTLDPQRRTARVRVAVGNPDGALRPGMFATATVAAAVDDEAPLVVPASAPLFTGRRSVVYVEQPEGEHVTYVPRTVRLGPRLGDVYPVVSGLMDGEHVVTRGAFAIDADLQIRGGPSMMTLPDDRQAPAVEPVETTAAERATLEPLVSAYLEVQRALAADDLEAVTAAGAALRDAVADVTLSSAAHETWRGTADALVAHGEALATAGDLERARVVFEPASAAIQDVLVRYGNPLETALRVAFCPMAFDNSGAHWVQEGEAIDNAYFGAKMRRCGEIQAVVAPGTHLATGER